MTEKRMVSFRTIAGICKHRKCGYYSVACGIGFRFVGLPKTTPCSGITCPIWKRALKAGRGRGEQERNDHGLS